MKKQKKMANKKKQTEQRHTNFYLMLIAIIFLMFGFSIGIWTYVYFGNSAVGMEDESVFNEIVILGNDTSEFDHCRNLGSVHETARCLRNYVKTFHNYTITKDSSRTLQDIKERGGDCYDYAQTYISLSHELGFLGGQNSMYPSSNASGHMFATMWDKDLTEYCVLDGVMIVNCVKLKQNEKEKKNNNL